MDEGWTRWVLEQYGFEFTRILATDIQAGSLRSKFDVLILANDGSVLEMPGRGGGGAPAVRGTSRSAEEERPVPAGHPHRRCRQTTRRASARSTTS